MRFFVSHESGSHAPYAEGNYESLLILYVITLFSENKMTFDSVKEKSFDLAHMVCIIVKGCKCIDGLSIEFQRCLEAHDQELTNNRTALGTHLV